MALFAKKKRPGWLALTEGPRGRIAHVEAGAEGRPRLTRLERLDETGAPSVDRLIEIRRQHSLDGYRCITALPPGQYRFIQQERPDLPEEELAEAMRWRVKDQLDFPVEEASIQILPVAETVTPGRPRLIHVVAARLEAVRELVQRHQRARIALEAIDVVELAQRNLASLFEESERGLAMLSLGADGGLFTFSAAGSPIVMRPIELPLPMLAAAEGERRYTLLDRLVLELQRSLDTIDRQYGHLPVTRLLLLPTPGLDELHSYLVENLYVPVLRANLGEVMDLSALSGLDPDGLDRDDLMAIGLALRE